MKFLLLLVVFYSYAQELYQRLPPDLLWKMSCRRLLFRLRNIGLTSTESNILVIKFRNIIFIRIIHLCCCKENKHKETWEQKTTQVLITQVNRKLFNSEVYKWFLFSTEHFYLSTHIIIWA